MSFTSQELVDTAIELRACIYQILSRPTEPDVLLGNHPLAVFASHAARIASWHGTRIETHLAEWINHVPDWDAKVRERILIAGRTYEIDNLACNRRLNIVLAVESKRVWINQPHHSMKDVRAKITLYQSPAVLPTIVSHVGMQTSDFRFFVFDAYGRTKKGSNGLSIIAGNKIANIFNNTLSVYLQWEQQVIANAIFEKLDPEHQDNALQEQLKIDVMNGTITAPTAKTKQEILDFIDKHAN